jgi:hypothetical protein
LCPTTSTRRTRAARDASPRRASRKHLSRYFNPDCNGDDIKRISRIVIVVYGLAMGVLSGADIDH